MELAYENIRQVSFPILVANFEYCRPEHEDPDFEQIETIPAPEPNIITTIDEIIDDGDDQNSLINDEELL